jgi:hypothetical protein
MRERVGSRRASFSDYAQGDHSVFMSNMIQEELPSMRELDEKGSSVVTISEESNVVEANTASATHQLAGQKPKHGLMRWAEAGNVRIYLMIAIFYPIAQGTRIVSDLYVRFWTDKTYFSSQQSNLEVYSWLVGG